MSFPLTRLGVRHYHRKMPNFIWLRPGINVMHHRKFNIKIHWEKKKKNNILILKYFFRFIDQKCLDIQGAIIISAAISN